MQPFGISLAFLYQSIAPFDRRVSQISKPQTWNLDPSAAELAQALRQGQCL